MRVDQIPTGSITLLHDQPFDLDLTLGCGQVFRWARKDGWWAGVVGDRLIRVRQEGRRIFFEGAGKNFIRDYFQLDLDLEAITSSFDRDDVIHRAIEGCRGLRIVRQPAWECTISFICATCSSIPMIKRRIEMICQKMGERLSGPASDYYRFPSPEDLAVTDPAILKECRAGYRGEYIRQAAARISTDGGWEERIHSLSYPEAREELMTLPGVGKKAADCILLFAFGRYEAFPVDVWIQRIMQANYPEAMEGRGDPCSRIGRFARHYFGPYAGYAQEYLYASRFTFLSPSRRDKRAGPL
ncbi:MAG: DNA glycosylase [Methanomicrobiales archaeon]|nr:DNA glycosylase [Methanomicrobiales archaeon]